MTCLNLQEPAPVSKRINFAPHRPQVHEHFCFAAKRRRRRRRRHRRKRNGEKSASHHLRFRAYWHSTRGDVQIYTVTPRSRNKEKGKKGEGEKQRKKERNTHTTRRVKIFSRRVSSREEPKRRVLEAGRRKARG